MAIYDDRQREVLLVAVQESDLVVQRRTRSVELLFDQPFLRWTGAMSAREGDTIRLMVRQEARTLCIGLALGLAAVLVSWWSPWLTARLMDMVAPVPGAWAGWAMRQRLLQRRGSIARPSDST